MFGAVIVKQVEPLMAELAFIVYSVFAVSSALPHTTLPAPVLVDNPFHGLTALGIERMPVQPTIMKAKIAKIRANGPAFNVNHPVLVML